MIAGLNLKAGDKPTLSGEIARGWLETGVPDCATLRDTYGLDRWNFSLSINSFRDRQDFIEEIGFGVPCKEAIVACVEHSPLIEAGAGTGFWSALITKASGDVVACDPGRTKIGDYPFKKRRGVFHPAERLIATTAVRRMPERNLLMVWPCYSQPWANEAAKTLSVGRTLLLVSEGRGGCVGDDGLFATLGRDFEEVTDIAIPQWPGINDYLGVWRKVRTTGAVP